MMTKNISEKILTLIQMKQTTLREGNAESNSADEF